MTPSLITSSGIAVGVVWYQYWLGSSPPHVPVPTQWQCMSVTYYSVCQSPTFPISPQISAYIDNEFDVAALMEEADAKADAIKRVTDLEDEVEKEDERSSQRHFVTQYSLQQVGRVNEVLQELEEEAMARQVEMENKVDDLKRERDKLLEKSQQVGIGHIIVGNKMKYRTLS